MQIFAIWLAAAGPEPVRVTSSHPELVLQDGATSVAGWRLGVGKHLLLEASGPIVVELTVRPLLKGRPKKPVGATLAVARNDGPPLEVALSFPRGKPARVSKGGKGLAGERLVRYLDVPAGAQRYALTVTSEDKLEGFALSLRAVESAADRALLLQPEPALAAAAAPTAPTVPLSTPHPSPEADPAPPPPPPAEPRTATVPVASTVESASVASPPAANGPTDRRTTDEPAAPEPIRSVVSDGTVGGATRALAELIAARYTRVDAGGAFHRVAVPYFKELGPDVEQHHLGRLVAELLATELGNRPPFVVVERERLDQVMREHRLADLGIVDEGSAAQLGKVLGAQSLVSGTVGEAGPAFLVAVRMVDVESGRVLVSGQVEIERAGLVALSSDAVVLRSKSGAAFRSLLVPGWGQFYNREPTKGLLFFAAGLGTLGSAAGFYVAANSARLEYEKNSAATVPQREVANERIRATNTLLIAYAAVWAVNLIDAYLSGVEATTVELPAGGSMALVP